LSKIHNVVVEIHRPTETYPGQVAEGRYTFEDGEVTLVDHVGQPVRDRDGKTYRKKLQLGSGQHEADPSVPERVIKDCRQVNVR
jgi:hypothetical protein